MSAPSMARRAVGKCTDPIVVWCWLMEPIKRENYGAPAFWRETLSSDPYREAEIWLFADDSAVVIEAGTIWVTDHYDRSRATRSTVRGAT